MAESYPSLAGGQRITASLLRSMLPQTVRKTADTARSATTSRTADPHLAFDAEANAVYTFHGWIKYDGDNAADISLQLTVPSGALGEVFPLGTGNTVVSSTSAPALTTNTASSQGYMVRTESLDINSARTFGAISTSNQNCVLFMGTVRMSTTAGTVSLDWAQASSNATATTVYTDGWLEFQRIA
ncbi:hypothetical protein [Streptomyces aurantiogriseus]|uniref:Uncharacterized protein n=1 Tax=Streptomyces aurantiogriseus TaxID=66870 RepID=A0A918KZY7_9ACTN|nr:hypothetical protein [Streptomyces aurantiogriseus]GGR61493.1 hypothetical protein GCM10010251_92930 [Streptomyces aurantiogriseus]